MRWVWCAWAVCVVTLSGCFADDVVRPRPRPNFEGKPRPAPGFHPWRKQMRQLRDGMSRSEVYRILGEPQKVVTASGFQKWRYGHPSKLQLVLTFRQDKLRNWQLGD